MRDEILNRLEEKGNIPPLPDILVRLESKIGDPGGQLEDIAQLIETEPVLAGRLLALSNSVFFGAGREKVLSLKGAVLRLGLKLILDLAYTLELPRIFSGVGFNQKRFWQHSLAVGVISQSMAGRLDPNRRTAELAYLGGLMHDVGVLVFYFLVPKEYRKFLGEVKETDQPLEVLERERFGICHAELGALFIKKWWPIEAEVVEAVRCHHQTLQASLDQDLVVASVSLSNAIANIHDWNVGLGHPLDALDRKFLVAQGMNLEMYKELVEEATEALRETQDILMQ